MLSRGVIVCQLEWCTYIRDVTLLQFLQIPAKKICATTEKCRNLQDFLKEFQEFAGFCRNLQEFEWHP